jgi:hypothetical protein
MARVANLHLATEYQNWPHARPCCAADPKGKTSRIATAGALSRRFAAERRRRCLERRFFQKHQVRRRYISILTLARPRKVRALPGSAGSIEDCNKKPRASAGSFLFQPPRLMAEGVNVDPLGSCMIGARVFPDKFGGLVAIGPAAPTVAPLKGRGTESPKFIAPSATANVVGRANAIASAIVASFMTYSFSLDKRKHGKPVCSFN